MKSLDCYHWENACKETKNYKTSIASVWHPVYLQKPHLDQICLFHATVTSNFPLSWGVNNNEVWNEQLLLLAWAAVHTVPYRLLSFNSSPSLHQEIAALGEALGRHPKSTSPPLWMTVDVFTGCWVKSGGEAGESASICFAWWRGNNGASAKMSSASPTITQVIFHHYNASL